MPIVRLSDHVINLIAAGEVVERPVAVIRELIDNSLDAGATKIGVEVIDGGLELIRVTDNGHGMASSDAQLAFERHATSKLLEARDLESIATLGFRGEALASIASVAKVRLLTRRAQDSLGTEVALSAGSAPEVATVAAPIGTTLEVRGLFFNQPARKKFMKLPRTELAKIRTHINAIALITPRVHITLKADGKEIDNFAPGASVHSRARALFGDELLLVESLGEVMRVEGGVTHPGTPQKAAAAVIVNGRVVQDRMILRAIREGYDSMLKSYELPGGFIAVTIRPDLVDVNVHPQKSEVRFRDSSAVFVGVRSAVKSALSGSLAALTASSSTPTFTTEDFGSADRRPVVFDNQTALPISRQGFSGRADFSGFIAHAASSELPRCGARSTLKGFSETASENVARVAESPVSFGAGSLSAVRLVGQVLGCYLIGEDELGLVAIDMHAAHERINYNRIRERIRQRTVPIQELLFPVTVRLSDPERAVLDERAQYFTDFGFRWESTAGEAVNVLSAPAFFASERIERVIKEACAVCAKHDHAQPLEAIHDAIAARLACHASVRSGDILSEQESYALLNELQETESGGACPHGRPVLRRFSRAAVESWFGRDR